MLAYRATPYCKGQQTRLISSCSKMTTKDYFVQFKKERFAGLQFTGLPPPFTRVRLSGRACLGLDAALSGGSRAADRAMHAANTDRRCVCVCVCVQNHACAAVVGQFRVFVRLCCPVWGCVRITVISNIPVVVDYWGDSNYSEILDLHLGGMYFKSVASKLTQWLTPPAPPPVFTTLYP